MTKEKKRVVVDTNLFVSGLLFPHSKPNRLIRIWRRQLFTIISSPALYSELEVTLNKLKITKDYQVSPKMVGKTLYLIKKYAIFIGSQFQTLIKARDPKDDMVLQTALEGKADYLVTGDKDLLILNEHPQIGNLKILTVKEFLEKIYA